MAKTANINLRVDPAFKSEVEQLYNSFGMSLTDAINIFLHVSLMEGGLPFEVRQPRFNAQTETAMQEARAIMQGKLPAKTYHTVNEMFADILNEDNTKHA